MKTYRTVAVYPLAAGFQLMLAASNTMRRARSHIEASHARDRPIDIVHVNLVAVIRMNGRVW